MADLNTQLRDVKTKESFFERVKRFIPGYDGYVNRDNSRELDTLLRDKLATELDANQTKLKNTVLNLSQKGKLFETDGINRLDKKLQTAVNKFRSASRGYSGAFDVVKVKDDKLNLLYEFDANLLDGVDQVSTACAELESNSKANSDISANVDKVGELLETMVRQFDQRDGILTTV